MAFDGEAFARSITTAAKSHIDRSLAPLIERLAKLEAQKPERGEKGDAGDRGPTGERGADGAGAADALIDRDGALVLTFTDGRSKNLGVVVGRDGKDGAPGREGVDGKDAAPVTREMILEAIASDPSIIAGAVSAAVAKHFDANPIPLPKNGKDGRDGVDGKDGERGPAGEKGEQGDRGLQGEKGDPGERGDQGDPGRAGEAGLPGKDGIDGKDGAPGERGERGEKGDAGKDGLSVVKFLIDQSGELVGTFNDGSVERLGVVKGADGRDGANGSDGKDGRDGVDGLGFDDMEVEYDGEKTVTLVYRRGELMKEARITIPAVIFRGYWAEGAEHTAGDMVSWAGQVYVAKETTTAKPDDDKAWALAVKRGRDGRDFTPKEPEAKKQVKIG